MDYSDYIHDGLTENAIFPDQVNHYVPKTLVDSTLEYIDPTPNVHTLFLQFNRRFFTNKLDSVQVKWSNRMTSCAGICTYHPKSRECIISLSAPLLKLRPRKDLVETLLHEMIHARLFIDNIYSDRNGHGRPFQEYMNKINKEAGTNITIYHDFHDEVRLYKQHWWRCNGNCQNKPPYYGMVRRAMNRAPSKNDFWWEDHKRTCNGTFIKIKDPESYKNGKQKSSSIKTSDVTKIKQKTPITKWFNTSNGSNFTGSSLSGVNKSNISTAAKGSSKTLTIRSNSTDCTKDSGIKKLGNSVNDVHGFNNKVSESKSSTINVSSGILKLGNKTNSVHGWGTSGPGSKPKTSVQPIFSSQTFSFSATLGGSGSGKSNLLDKYTTMNVRSTTASKNKNQKNNNNCLDNFLKKNKAVNRSLKQDDKSNKVPCPVCNHFVMEEKINLHLDSCLLNNSDLEKIETKVEQKTDFGNNIIKQDYTNSPMCERSLKEEKVNNHSFQASGSSKKRKWNVAEICDLSSSSNTQPNRAQTCLICNKIIDINITLNEHLEDCIGDLFNDNTIDGEVESVTEVNDCVNKNMFPCPVCMTLVADIDMNNHLDSCLTQN